MASEPEVGGHSLSEVTHDNDQSISQARQFLVHSSGAVQSTLEPDHITSISIRRENKVDPDMERRQTSSSSHGSQPATSAMLNYTDYIEAEPAVSLKPHSQSDDTHPNDSTASVRSNGYDFRGPPGQILLHSLNLTRKAARRPPLAKLSDSTHTEDRIKQCIPQKCHRSRMKFSIIFSIS